MLSGAERGSVLARHLIFQNPLRIESDHLALELAEIIPARRAVSAYLEANFRSERLWVKD